MASFKAICIKGGEGINQGDIVKAWKGFSYMYYRKGLRFKVGMELEEFWEHFVCLNSYYIVEKPIMKRRFRRPKKQFLRIEFPNIPEEQLILLYNCVFSYIELIKQKNPELIQTFNYSIVSTLEKLEYLYGVLSPYEFKEAVKDSEQVFKGIYKTAISLELQAFPEQMNYNQMLESFKVDNRILSEFFKELNKM